MSGGVVLYMDAPIAWWTRLQRSISASTAEAEYFSASLASREAVYLRDLLDDIGHGAPAPTPMWLDSKAAIDLTADPIAFKKTKHIMRHAYELRDRISRRLFAVGFVPSEDQLADVLTKALRPHDHARLVPRILQTSKPTTPTKALAARLHTKKIFWRITTFLLTLTRLFTTLAAPPSLPSSPIDEPGPSTYPTAAHLAARMAAIGPDRLVQQFAINRHAPIPAPNDNALECMSPTLRRRHLQPADATRDAWPRQLW
jgi:hypothetical protein